MILDFFYITLIVFAVIALQTGVLRNAIIYLSVFSLLCSVAYLLLGAPDVAIAEAVIGCTLSTILYLVALKKYRIFSVYYRCISDDFDELMQLKKEKEDMKGILTKYASNKELQLDIINTNSTLEELEHLAYDVVIFHTNKGIWLHGLRNSYQYTELAKSLEQNMSIPIHVQYTNEEEESSTIAGE
jgi:uncharacterized MnhB-related membrane protein